MKSFNKELHRIHLTRLLKILEKIKSAKHERVINKLKLYLNTLCHAGNEDLQKTGWEFPSIPPNLALLIQSYGVQKFGDDYYNPIHDLMFFGYSEISSREKTAYGSLKCAARPQIPGNVIVFSGASNHELLQHRLALPEIYNPFTDYQFEHPDTRWYNIASTLGSSTNFIKNSPQILDFFTALIIKRLHEGKRVLLVSRKKFKYFCADYVNKQLLSSGIKASVITETDDQSTLQYPHEIPLITYGVIGINHFQEFDCAYCLNSYFIAESTVSSTLQDILPSNRTIPLRLTFSKNANGCGRRSIEAESVSDRYYDVSKFAPATLNDLEMGAVIQAVGRVRPFTKPREIVTFQCSALSTGPYHAEFSNLQEARAFFSIKSTRQQEVENNISRIQTSKKSGLTQKKTAEQHDLSLRTVKTYWNKTA